MVEEGEQLELIKVGPEHSAEIEAVTKEYVRRRDARIKASNRETEKNKELRGLIDSEKLQPLEGGKIKVKCGTYTISVTPTEFKLKVTEDAE